MNEGRNSVESIYGHPVQIVDVSPEHKFQLNEQALRSVLFQPKCRSRRVAVLSVAGAFRRGKSFLLDFFLRYLRRKSDDWLGDPDEPLTGFHWRGGCERDTTGILMWSEPFILDTVIDGRIEQIAVLLMDTQGAFDSQSTVRDCATVFALSLMISSIHIYNITQNLQEDNLQHLDLFAEYGTLALDQSSAKPFQKLTFLIRDWSYPYEASYGYEGGEVLLKKRLELKQDQDDELKVLRSRLKECFNTIDCFLMPHPGLVVATNPNFDGRLKDIVNDFVNQMKEFIESVFSADRLQIKKINGEEITCSQLFEYFKAYCTVLQSDELPHPKAMLQATAEANNLAAKAAAKDLYSRIMESECGGDRPYMHQQHLAECHEKARKQSIDKFNSAKKMGGEAFSSKYLEALEAEIEETHQTFVKHNESKNIFALSRTPTTFIVILIASYVLSNILNALWLSSLCLLCTSVFWIAFVALIVWFYSRYTGDFKQLGDYVDQLADLIWSYAYQPVYSQLMESSVRAIVNSTLPAIGGSGS
ncbi:hypothetical protein ACOME3_003984 [Neoechinorhynchus agilis]